MGIVNISHTHTHIYIYNNQNPRISKLNDIMYNMEKRLKATEKISSI